MTEKWNPARQPDDSGSGAGRGLPVVATQPAVFELPGDDRMAKMKTLAQITAHAGKRDGNRLAFDAFGYNPQTHGLGEGDKRLNYVLVGLIFEYPQYERPVYLNFVNG